MKQIVPFVTSPSTCSVSREAEEQKVDGTLGSLLRHLAESPRVQITQTLRKAVEYFEKDNKAPGVLVYNSDKFVTMLSQTMTMQRLAQPFVRELFYEVPVARLLANTPLDVMQMDESDTVSQAIEAAKRRPVANRFEPIIVVEASGNRTVVDFYHLLSEQCRLLATTLEQLETQREATLAAEEQRAEMQDRLITASRQAGMAEIATGILHNVGNVLNSVNVSASVVTNKLSESKLANLTRALTMVREHENDLPDFISSDERGQRLPGYLLKVADLLVAEHETLLREMQAINQSIEHIATIVSSQQQYARGSVARDAFYPADLIEDVLRLNATSLERHGVAVETSLDKSLSMLSDRHMVMQILINVVRNAKDAMTTQPAGHRKLHVAVEAIDVDGEPGVRFSVRDNGSGIAPEHMSRIFSHGFTTREQGHGFGLHNAINAARQLGGDMSVHSMGLGHGATFTLELPLTMVTVEGR